MWEIFGINKVPFDGVLISRIVIENDKKKYSQILDEGIHKALRLPQNFKIIGDCGAFGYITQKKPPFDPIRMLEYYKEIGFNYGVSVDHLVVSQFESDKDERMRITYENGVKSLEEWSSKFKKDFQILLAVQGWEISDYLRMYRKYVNLGATHLAFGGLVRCPTSYVNELINQLICEIRTAKNVPQYLHFFGLARIALFPQLKELEELGITVSFDSASYLRKAWLSSPTAELNYLTSSGRGYTAIRVPFVRGHRKTTPELAVIEKTLSDVEQDCLRKLRGYEKGSVNIEQVLAALTEYDKIRGKVEEFTDFYRRALVDRPWNSCGCPICSELGIEVLLFRGNNRNRRRGFHNVNIFYKVLRDEKLWLNFVKKRLPDISLDKLQKKERVLVITGCSKEKLGNTNSIKAPAEKMYQGRLFKKVKAYASSMGFDYVIISAKYGLLQPTEIIEGYDQVLKHQGDIRRIQPIVEDKLKVILPNYDKIIVIAGENYRKVVKNISDNRFFKITGKGYADLCVIVEKATPKSSLAEY